MEISLKKTTAAVIALGLSGLASASGYAPACTKYDVSVPCQVSGWDAGFEALALEPMNQEMFYTSTSPRFQINPRFRFGFRVEGSYHFGQGNDATLNWTRFNEVYTSRDGLTLAAQADGRAEFRYDLANLEYGQHFDVGPRLDVRAFFGPSFLRVDHSTDVAGATTGGTRFQSRFNGGGFRGGFDGLYHLVGGFSLAAHANSGLFVGDVESKNFSITGTTVSTTPSVITNIDTRTVVPYGQMKMGLNWATSSSMGNISGEVGYDIAGAFNSVHHLQASATNPAAATSSDFGYQAFYVNVKVDTL